MKTPEKECLIHLLLDGFDSHYLTHAPFLAKQIGAGFGRPLKIPSLFGARGMIFSGTLPGSNQVFTDMWRDPQRSRFRFLNRFQPAGIFAKHPIRRLLRIVVRLASGYPCPLPANLPSQMLTRFDAPWISRRFSVFRGPSAVPTLLDHLKTARVPFQYFGPPFSGFWKKDLMALAGAIEKQTRYVFAHIVSPDTVGHRFGPASPTIVDLIGHLDHQVEKLHSVLRSRFSHMSLLIHSDHGMSRIGRSLDLWSRIKKWPFRVGKDVDYFLDSTMIRLWILNSAKADRIRTQIGEDIPEARLLTRDELQEAGLTGLDKRFGEEIAVIKEGDLICPNFYQPYPIAGMHGYLKAASRGFIAWSGMNLKNAAEPSLLDVFPTVLSLLQINFKGPLHGKSLLSN